MVYYCPPGIGERRRKSPSVSPTSSSTGDEPSSNDTKHNQPTKQTTNQTNKQPNKQATTMVYYCPPGIGERRRKSPSVSPTSSSTGDEPSSNDTKHNQQRGSKKNGSPFSPGTARASAIRLAHSKKNSHSSLSFSETTTATSSSSSSSFSPSSNPRSNSDSDAAARGEETERIIDGYQFQYPYHHRSYAVPKRDGTGFDLKLPVLANAAAASSNGGGANTDDVHPGKQRMKKQRKRKTVAGTIGGMVVGGVALGPVGVIAGAFWGGVATREISKKGEKRAQRKHEQDSFRLSAMRRGVHWKQSGAVFC
uniref:Uncharacterized protein n=1 Tax=Pseudo-nitzschia australis TaxID=44445 RepID=A0A7S4EM85_9STRA